MLLPVRLCVLCAVRFVFVGMVWYGWALAMAVGILRIENKKRKGSKAPFLLFFRKLFLLFSGLGFTVSHYYSGQCQLDTSVQSINALTRLPDKALMYPRSVCMWSRPATAATATPMCMHATSIYPAQPLSFATLIRTFLACLIALRRPCSLDRDLPCLIALPCPCSFEMRLVLSISPSSFDLYECNSVFRSVWVQVQLCAVVRAAS